MLLVSLLLAAMTVGVTAVALSAGHHVVRREAGRPAVAPVHSATTRALSVLRAWDRRRASAWARSDPAALGDLYVAGSAASRQDLAMLAAYRSRGVRVVSMDRQMLAAQVRRSTRRRIVVLVTDRLVDAVALGAAGRTRLPDGRAVRRLIDLRRIRGRWLVAAVRQPVPQPAR